MGGKLSCRCKHRRLCDACGERSRSDRPHPWDAGQPLADEIHAMPCQKFALEPGKLDIDVGQLIRKRSDTSQT
jgi:hypothetical protein